MAAWGYGLSEVEQIVVDGGKAEAAQNAPRAENIRGTAADDTAAQAGAEFDPFHDESDDYDETVTDER
jgi:ParB family chromosome partitioning protein